MLTIPFPIREPQVFFHPTAVMAGFGTGEPAVYQLDIAAMLLGFVEQLPFHLEETGITDSQQALPIWQKKRGRQRTNEQVKELITFRIVRGHWPVGLSSANLRYVFWKG